LSNYQVNVALNSSFNFGLAQSNGRDLRVTAADGVSQIPFWVERWTPSAGSASIWINVPTIGSSGATVYLYFGNAGAGSVSNGTSTFNFFDDFESGSIASSKWTASGGA